MSQHRHAPAHRKGHRPDQESLPNYLLPLEPTVLRIDPSVPTAAEVANGLAQGAHGIDQQVSAA